MGIRILLPQRRNAQMSKSNWTEEYTRGVAPHKKYKPEHPSTRGTKVLTRIWDRIRPSLVERGIVDVPVTLPKDVSKWAVMPDWCELLEKHPHVGRNVFEWLDSWLPSGGHVFRGGAMTLRHRSDRATAREKQNGQGQNDPTPAFTFHGNRMEFDLVKENLIKEMNRISAEGGYPNKDFEKLDFESVEKWRSVMGGRCGTYTLAESSILFTGMTPHQESGAPIPWDIFWESWRKVLIKEFPGATDGPILQPKHLFVGSGDSGGIRIQNSDGAAGYPYSNTTRDHLRKWIDRPKFQGRPTKGVVFPHAMRDMVEWIREGMPMNGPLYDKMAQPATLAFRGDRAVDLDIRALGSRGGLSQFHEGADQLAAMMPGRSVIIVPTVIVLAQSSWAQPLGDYIAGAGTPGFDWVDPWHTSDRLDTLRRLDIDQAGDEPRALVGADASGWDRDLTCQMHAGETAWYCAMFPEEVRLVVIDAQLPLSVGDEWIANALGSIPDGEEVLERVIGIRNDGVEVTQDGKVSTVSFNYHEFICKIMSMVNDAPIAWADYEVDAQGSDYTIDAALPRLSGTIVSNGGRRSGDAATGIGNSWSNLVITDAGAEISQTPSLSKMVARRCAVQGEEPGGPYDIVDVIGRGDDLAVVVSLLRGGLVPSQCVATGIIACGLRANASKQEASDIPGHPVAGFANVVITENYMGKVAGRTVQRYLVQESTGLDKDTLDIMREEIGDLELELGIMTSTGTAKSRLAPLAGFPLLDTHPIASWAVQLGVHNDKYRLAYMTAESVDADGLITDEGRDMLARAKDVEARAQARLRARRENVSVDLESLKEAYLESTVHDLVEQHALVDGFNPTQKMEDFDNLQSFKDLVQAH
jgi:hypothetical protein